MAIPELLERLLTAPGPSGHEAPAAAVWRDAAAAFAEVSGDMLGTSWVRVPGTAGGPLLAVVGHIDEIGVVVTHVGDDGLIACAVSAAGIRTCCSGSGSRFSTREGPLGGGRVGASREAEGRRGAEAGRIRRHLYRHRREERRGGARARAAGRCGRRCRRTARASQRTDCVARRSTTGSGATSRSRWRVARRRKAARPATSRESPRCRRRSAHRRLARGLVRARAGRRDRGRRHVRDRRARRRSGGGRRARARLRRGDHARAVANRASRTCSRDRRGGVDPVHDRGLSRPDPTDADAVMLSDAASPPGSSRSRSATCTRRARRSLSDSRRHPLLVAFARRLEPGVVVRALTGVAQVPGTSEVQSGWHLTRLRCQPLRHDFVPGTSSWLRWRA